MFWYNWAILLKSSRKEDQIKKFIYVKLYIQADFTSQLFIIIIIFISDGNNVLYKSFTNVPRGAASWIYSCYLSWSPENKIFITLDQVQVQQLWHCASNRKFQMLTRIVESKQEEKTHKILEVLVFYLFVYFGNNKQSKVKAVVRYDYQIKRSFILDFILLNMKLYISLKCKFKKTQCWIKNEKWNLKQIMNILFFNLHYTGK